MIQVWMVDDNNYYTGESCFIKVEKIQPNTITVPITKGYVKPKFDGELNDWVEGATEEEVKEWEETNTTSIPQKTTEERLEEMDANITDLQKMYYELLLEV